MARIYRMYVYIVKIYRTCSLRVMTLIPNQLGINADTVTPERKLSLVSFDFKIYFWNPVWPLGRITPFICAASMTNEVECFLFLIGRIIQRLYLLLYRNNVWLFWNSFIIDFVCVHVAYKDVPAIKGNISSSRYRGITMANAITPTRTGFNQYIFAILINRFFTETRFSFLHALVSFLL